jgi:hypothetical protein
VGRCRCLHGSGMSGVRATGSWARKIARSDLRRPDHRGEDARRGSAGSRAEGRPWSRPSSGRAMVDPDGSLWRTCAAIPNDRAMPQWRLWLATGKCHRCEIEASIPLEHVRRPRIHRSGNLRAALKCRSCRTPRYSPRVHMIKLTQQREAAPYKWVHPDDDERR